MSFFALFAIGDAYTSLQPPLAIFLAGPTSGPLTDPVLACRATQVPYKGFNQGLDAMLGGAAKASARSGSSLTSPLIYDDDRLAYGDEFGGETVQNGIHACLPFLWRRLSFVMTFFALFPSLP